jgi:hypothetical protein
VDSDRIGLFLASGRSCCVEKKESLRAYLLQHIAHGVNTLFAF